MATNMDNHGAPRKRWSLTIWGVAAALLLVPAVAMQFTDEVRWTGGDFLVMGLMLSMACGLYEALARRGNNAWYRVAAGIAIGTGFVTVWVNLAVGMLGSEGNPENLLFAGVLLVAAVGAVLARVRASRMARAMQAAALAQGAITLYALFGGYAEVAVLVGLFILPWLVAALLFTRAAR